VSTVRRALPCGDYGLAAGGRLIAAVERKSLADLVASLTGGKLRYALAELAAPGQAGHPKAETRRGRSSAGGHAPRSVGRPGQLLMATSAQIPSQ
jgi:hypothetical protein